MDRTSELLQYARSVTSAKSAGSAPTTLSSKKSTRSAFQDAAGEIAKGIHRCSNTLGKLSKLVQRQGLFDDPTEEINTLIFRVKQELGELNSKCDTAQQYVESQRRGRSAADVTQGQGAHHGKVVTQLKHGLADATRSFKGVLEVRSSKMKDQQSRKEALTGGGHGMLSPMRANIGASSNGKDTNNPMQRYGHGITTTSTAADTGGSAAFPYGGVRGAAMNYDMYSQDYSSPSSSGAGASAGGDYRWSGQGQPNCHEEQQLLLAPPVQAQYYEARETAVLEVESTIGELGQLFKRLTTMIQEQGEMVERIDEDIENASSHVESASEQLQKAYDAASSNTTLYAKLGGILLFFLVFFSVFLL